MVFLFLPTFQTFESVMKSSKNDSLEAKKILKSVGHLQLERGLNLNLNRHDGHFMNDCL